MVSKKALATLPLFFSLGICAIYDQASDLKKTNYDFVIVGGRLYCKLQNLLSIQSDICNRRDGWSCAGESFVRKRALPSSYHRSRFQVRQ